MGEIQNYVSRRRVMAEKLTEGEYVNSSAGRRWANSGDYVVYTGEGAFIVPGAEFEREYELIPSDVSKYDPAGKTVPEVIEFMRENPREVERIKELESIGGARKGILDYAVG